MAEQLPFYNEDWVSHQTLKIQMETLAKYIEDTNTRAIQEQDLRRDSKMKEKEKKRELKRNRRSNREKERTAFHDEIKNLKKEFHGIRNHLEKMQIESKENIDMMKYEGHRRNTEIMEYIKNQEETSKKRKEFEEELRKVRRVDEMEDLKMKLSKYETASNILGAICILLVAVLFMSSMPSDKTTTNGIPTEMKIEQIPNIIEEENMDSNMISINESNFTRLNISVSFHQSVGKDEIFKIMNLFNETGSKNFPELGYRIVEDPPIPSNITFYIFSSSSIANVPSISTLKRDLKSSNIVLFYLEYDSVISSKSFYSKSGIDLDGVFHEISVRIRMKIVKSDILDKGLFTKEFETILRLIRSMNNQQ